MVCPCGAGRRAKAAATLAHAAGPLTLPGLASRTLPQTRAFLPTLNPVRKAFTSPGRLLSSLFLLEHAAGRGTVWVEGMAGASCGICGRSQCGSHHHKGDGALTPETQLTVAKPGTETACPHRTVVKPALRLGEQHPRGLAAGTRSCSGARGSRAGSSLRAGAQRGPETRQVACECAASPGAKDPCGAHWLPSTRGQARPHTRRGLLPPAPASPAGGASPAGLGRAGGGAPSPAALEVLLQGLEGPRGRNVCPVDRPPPRECRPAQTQRRLCFLEGLQHSNTVVLNVLRGPQIFTLPDRESPNVTACSRNRTHLARNACPFSRRLLCLI